MNIHDLIDHGMTTLMPSRAARHTIIGATVTISEPPTYYPPPRPQREPMEPLTAALILGGVGVLCGGLFFWSEKRRKERQAGMTPAERSMDDYLQAQANRPAYYGGGYGYGYPPPYYGPPPGTSVSFNI